MPTADGLSELFLAPPELPDHPAQFGTPPRIHTGGVETSASHKRCSREQKIEWSVSKHGSGT